MSRQDAIDQLIGDGAMVIRCIDPINEYDDLARPPDWPDFEAFETIDEKLGQPVDDGISDEELVARIQEMLETSKPDMDDDIRNLLARTIALDIDLVSRSLEYKVNIPFVTALWLSYRAGKFPVEPLQVDRPLKEVLNLPLKDARRLLAEAKRKVAKEETVDNLRDAAIGKRVAAACQRLPNSGLLREILLRQHHDAVLGLEDSASVLATVPSELPDDVSLPKSWLRLLREQERGDGLDWEPMWRGFEKLLPMAYAFLESHCCGVAVLCRPNVAPHLLYVYPCKSEEFDCGYSYRAFVGGPPTPKKVPKSLRSAYDVIPPKLQPFYHQVHDGWVELSLLEYGPLPLSHIKPLADTLDDTQSSGLDADNLWEVMRVNGGRAFCIDATTSGRNRPKAALWFAASPESGLDFWKAVRDWMRDGLEMLVSS